jgi:hypothetical protein
MVKCVGEGEYYAFIRENIYYTLHAISFPRPLYKNVKIKIYTLIIWGTR